jgi:hypothetical protein
MANLLMANLLMANLLMADRLMADRLMADLLMDIRHTMVIPLIMDMDIGITTMIGDIGRVPPSRLE